MHRPGCSRRAQHCEAGHTGRPRRASHELHVCGICASPLDSAVQGLHMDLTPALKAYAEDKVCLQMC